MSLRRRFLWLLIGVVGLFTAGMVLSRVFSLRSNEAAVAHLLNAEAVQAKANVMRRWDYCRDLVNAFRAIRAGQTWLQDAESDTIGQALARADRALYQAKERGRGHLVFAAALAGKDAG